MNIEKLMRGLKTFTLDEIEMLTEINIEEILLEMIEIGTLEKNGDEYTYLEKIEKSGILLKDIPANIKKEINISFIDGVELFFEDCLKKNLAPSTLRTYKYIINSHLVPFFKRTDANVITAKSIENFIAQKVEEKLSAKRINSCVTLLGTILKYLEINSYIEKSPYFGIQNIRFEKETNVQILDKNQVEKLLKELELKYPYIYILVSIVLETGLKKNEICALKSDDIDFELKQISVNKTIYLGNMITPRGKCIIRKISLPDKIFSLLKTLRPFEDGFLFYNPNFSYQSQDEKARIYLKQTIEKLGLPKLIFNDLRHTFAYNFLQTGRSIDSLHKQLGDYSIQATMDKYKKFIK